MTKFRYAALALRAISALLARVWARAVFGRQSLPARRDEAVRNQARRDFAKQAASVALLVGASGCATQTWSEAAPPPSPLPTPGRSPDEPPPPPSPPGPPMPGPPDAGLPAFPWPAPTPTDHTVLPPMYFATARNQWDVNRALRRALNGAGYSGRYSYYSVPNGFALVARIERLRSQDDPSPDEEERFGLADEGAPGLIGAVLGVLFPRVGFYRQVVFLVTDQPWRPQSGPLPPPLNAAQAEIILRNGARTLPEGYRRMPFGAGYQVTALIYEFVNRQGDQRTRASAAIEKRHNARTHLMHAGIWRRLQN